MRAAHCSADYRTALHHSVAASVSSAAEAERATACLQIAAVVKTGSVRRGLAFVYFLVSDARRSPTRKVLNVSFAL